MKVAVFVPSLQVNALVPVAFGTFSVAHVLGGEPASTSPERALSVVHVLGGEPASTSPERAPRVVHVLGGEPVSTSPEQALGLR